MILFGAGGHFKVVCSALEELGVEITGFFDDNPLVRYPKELKYLGIYNSDTLSNEKIILTVGDNFIRSRISRIIYHSFGSCISSNSIFDKYSTFGEGTVVLQGVVVQRDVYVGKHVILNTLSSLDHDCYIDDFVHISPGARLAGGVHVGEGTHIGLNATVIPNIKIGKWSLIGAGSVIIRDVPDFSVVVGNPGRIIKYNRFEK